MKQNNMSKVKSLQELSYDKIPCLTMHELVLEKSYIYVHSNGTTTNLGRLIGKIHNMIHMCWHDGPTWEKILIFDNEIPEDLKQEMLYSDKIHLIEI